MRRNCDMLTVISFSFVMKYGNRGKWTWLFVQLIWRRKVATPSSDLPVERLVISNGETLNICKSRIQKPGRSKTVSYRYIYIYINQIVTYIGLPVRKYLQILFRTYPQLLCSVLYVKYLPLSCTCKFGVVWQLFMQIGRCSFLYFMSCFVYLMMWGSACPKTLWVLR